MKTRIKAIKTNILNRLIVIISEDIGIADTNLPLQVKELLSDDSLSYSEKVSSLIALMMKTKKTRFISEC